MRALQAFVLDNNQGMTIPQQWNAVMIPHRWNAVMIAQQCRGAQQKNVLDQRTLFFRFSPLGVEGICHTT